jgi:hypothetical protein
MGDIFTTAATTALLPGALPAPPLPPPQVLSLARPAATSTLGRVIDARLPPDGPPPQQMAFSPRSGLVVLRERAPQRAATRAEPITPKVHCWVHGAHAGCIWRTMRPLE